MAAASTSAITVPPSPAPFPEELWSGDVATQPNTGHALYWSADNQLGVASGNTILIHDACAVAGYSSNAGPPQTWLRDRSTRYEMQLGVPMPGRGQCVTASEKFRFLECAHVLNASRKALENRKSKSHTNQGRAAANPPTFRSMAWSPRLVGDNSACLAITCSSDHYVGVYAPPTTTYGQQWLEIGCLSELLLTHLKRLKFQPRLAVLPDDTGSTGEAQNEARTYLDRKALAAALTVTWSQRVLPTTTATASAETTTVLAAGGHRFLAVFTHTCRHHDHVVPTGTAARHSFSCVDVVALPVEASYVTAMAVRGHIIGHARNNM